MMARKARRNRKRTKRKSIKAGGPTIRSKRNGPVPRNDDMSTHLNQADSQERPTPVREHSYRKGCLRKAGR